MKMRKMSISDEKAKNPHTSLKWPLPDVEEVTDLGEQVETKNQP